MSSSDRPTPPLSNDPPPAGPRGTLVALVMLALLALGGWWLVSHLRAANRVQDCVMAGRRNCG